MASPNTSIASKTGNAPITQQGQTAVPFFGTDPMLSHAKAPAKAKPRDLKVK